MKTIRQIRQYGPRFDESALEIVGHVVGLLGCFERNDPRRVLPSDKYFEYILENSVDSSIGGHFDGYLWASCSPDGDFRLVTKTTVLSDWGGLFLDSDERCKLTRERWIKTLEDRNGELKFGYDEREFEVALSSYMTATDSVKFWEALSRYHSSVILGKR